jgi:hypothetical protein
MSDVQGHTTTPGDTAFYAELLPLHPILPINVGLSSASPNTMSSLLGAPGPGLTTDDQPDKASQRVKDLLDRRRTIARHIQATGLHPALDSLVKVLAKTFAHEKAQGHDLESVLGTAGMLNVRFARPTDGSHPHVPSNHSWGCAIDFCLVGRPAPGNTHGMVPRFIAALIPAMNEEGWFAGIGFHSPDAMHFEVAEQTITAWSKQGLLVPAHNPQGHS